MMAPAARSTSRPRSRAPRLLVLLLALLLPVVGTTVAKAGDLPGAPTYVAGRQAEGAVELSWGPPVGSENLITGYIACLDDSSCVTLGPTQWSTTFAGLTNGSRYHPYVAAMSSSGRGPSVAVEGGVLAAGVPGPPLGLTTSMRPGGVVRLSWSGVDGRGESPYLYTWGRADGQGARYFDAAAWDQRPGTAEGAGAYFVDVPDLQLGATYEYAVTATNNTGTGRPATVSFTVGAPFRSPGFQLDAGQSVTSLSGAYSFRLQADGNFVVYHSSGRAVWHSWTWGHAGGRLAMQTDGNLVAYDRAGRALWHSDTWGHPDARLYFGDDGRLIIFDPAGRALWSSAEDGGPVTNNNRLRPSQQLTPGQTLYSPYGYYRLTLQPDGNAVVYRRDGRVMWHSWTFGQPGSRMTMQNDGNPVIYTPDRRVAWNAGTWGNPDSSLTMQDDGNLVVYAYNGRALWSSMYGRTY